MSDSDKEIVNDGGGGDVGGSVGSGGGGDDDDDEEGCGGVVARGDDKKKKREKGYRRDLHKAKQVVLFPFRKAKKQLYKRNNNNGKKKRSSASVSAAPAASASGSGKRFGCYMCFTQPPTSEESPDTAAQTSDPNSPRFTLESLKVLIEKNDFYSKECNPHVDIFSSFSD